MLILASASPRRRDLLTAAGFEFRVLPAHLNEDPRPDEPPAVYVERLAREKAVTALRSLAVKLPVFADEYQVTLEDYIPLGADTTVTLDDEILGKPADAADAARMLRRLSGRTHAVITGVAIVAKPDAALVVPPGDATMDTESFTETTLVTMHPLSDAQIAAYIATGEPMDKAGAYAIQGGAAAFIAGTDGDYDNVVGLPVTRVAARLRAHGILPAQ